MADVKTLMVTEMVTARPDETVLDVARRMSANRIGAVLVIDGGALRGLFSERDLMTRVVGEGRNPEKTPVGEVSTHELVTISADARLKSVLAVFRDKKFRHLPVVDGDRPVGILSTRDLLDHLVEGFERYFDEMKYKRELAEGVDPYDHMGGSYGR